MKTAIQELRARQILDSRGNPTVEAEAVLRSGARGRAAVPSGASTGSREAVEVRDGGPRFAGRGVSRAVAAVVETIAPVAVGRDALDQGGLDQAMCDLDGTPDKSRLGANAILAVSLAAARAAAVAVGLPLFRYLGGPSARVLPVPMLNVLNGGAHAANPLDVQEFMLVPGGFPSFSEALRAGAEVYQALKKTLSGRGLTVNVGDEGGFAPDLAQTRDALDALLAAIESAGYRPGEEIALALDVAATELHREGEYHIDGQKLDAARLVDFYERLAADYPIASIEDGMAEDDWAGWTEMTARLGEGVQLVGDDLFVTDEATLLRGVEQGAANAILVKVNQIGSLSEAMRALEAARGAGYGRVVSHRSGETEDVFIAHLATAVNAGQIKTGAPARSERTAKYNELLRIEERLGEQAAYRGFGALAGRRGS